MARYIPTKELPGRLGEKLGFSKRQTRGFGRRGAELRPFQLQRKYGKRVATGELRNLGTGLLESGKLKRRQPTRLKKLMKRPRRGFF